MTDSSQIIERLTAIFRDVLDDEEITLTPATTADDVDGWDSIAHIRLMIETQSVFGVKFSAAEIGKLNNIGDFVALVGRRLG